MLKIVLEELKQTPDNQPIDFDKIKLCLNSKRRSLKSTLRSFLADFLNNDLTFQQIKKNQSGKSQDDVQVQEIIEKLNTMAENQDLGIQE